MFAEKAAEISRELKHFTDSSIFFKNYSAGHFCTAALLLLDSL